MRKIAFVFPGQGAQYSGMGEDFYKTFTLSKEIFDKASEISGINIPKLCFGNDDRINETKYTQIAILTTSLSILKVIEKIGYTPSVNAGLSLGEYTALVASKAINPEDAFMLVKKRGQYMQEAYPDGGAMAAVIGLETEIVEKICEEKKNQEVYIANYNCPGQIVISGKKSVLEKLYNVFEERGAKMVVPLNVSGPFHSPLLNKAKEQMKKELDEVNINNFEIPYVANVNAEYIYDGSVIKSLLCAQIVSPVRWKQSIDTMIKQGVDAFIEIGPNKTLANMIKKIDSNINVINVQNIADLDRLKELKCI